jgi:hypothetical protein
MESATNASLTICWGDLFGWCSGQQLERHLSDPWNLERIITVPLCSTADLRQNLEWIIQYHFAVQMIYAGSQGVDHTVPLCSTDDPLLPTGS